MRRCRTFLNGSLKSTRPIAGGSVTSPTHTHEGFLFLAVVMDLFARNIVGWSMASHMTGDLVLDALTMAYWRRKAQATVMLHSDQGWQYTSRRRKQLLKTWNIEQSMSRRGNCHDIAVAESFFARRKSDENNTAPVMTHAVQCLNTSSCSTIRGDVTLTTSELHRRFTNSNT